MTIRTALFALGIFIGFTVGPAQSFERMQGCFIADQVCAAKSSIRRNRNPGAIQLDAGSTYLLLGANKKNATHFQVRIPGAKPADRWVETSCGRIIESCELVSTDIRHETVRPPTTISRNNVIAISWQPSFCQTHQSKKECASQTADRFDASHFTLHGLWPQPRSNIFCGVSQVDNEADRRKRWDLLPALPLSDALRAKLNVVMPGTQSLLQRHEWIKHGSCYGATPEIYYRHSLSLIKQINESVVRELFTANVGKMLSVAEVRTAFDAAFGRGAGQRVTMSCAGRGNDRLIVELIIALDGRIGPATKVSDLISSAKPRRPGCGRGLVDPVGF